MNNRRQWIFKDAANQDYILRGYEEDDDIVILAVCKDKWIVKFDQSPYHHGTYHSHIDRKDDIFEKFPDAVTKEQKVEIAMNKLNEYISKGLVANSGTVFSLSSAVSSALLNIKNEMLNRDIDRGVIRGRNTIQVSAYIIKSPNDFEKAK